MNDKCYYDKLIHQTLIKECNDFNEKSKGTIRSFLKVVIKVIE